MLTRWSRSDWLILLGVAAVAAFFRLWQIQAVPPGYQFDEAYNAADALRVLAGERPLFFEANGGREALHVYLIAPFVAALGADTPLPLHLAAAFAGIASVALSYALWRRFLPPGERAAAALAALWMALSYWHVHFSRYGIRAILMPLMLTLVCYCLWAATMPGQRREWVVARAAKNWRAAAESPLLPLIWCGVFLGLSIYAHPAARFIPLLIVLWFGWLWRRGDPAESPLRHFASASHRLRSLSRDLLVIAAVSMVVFLPLGMYFLGNPGAFFGHPTVVAVTDARVSGGSVLGALAENAARIAGMFFVRGDPAWIHNLADRPVFDAAAALCFVVGLIEWYRRVRAGSPVAVFLAFWLPLMLLPTLLSDGAPNFSRAIGIMPALFLIPAWGMVRLYDLMRNGLSRTFADSGAAGAGMARGVAGAINVPLLVCAAMIGSSAVATYRDYFEVFPARPELYIAYDIDKQDAAKHLLAQAASYRVFLPPLWSEHATFALLTRNAGFRSFDNGEVMVLPSAGSGPGMLYGFPAHGDPAYMEEFERTYGALASKRVVPDARGVPLLVEYTVAPKDLPARAEDLPATLPVAPRRLVNANFGGVMRLAGYRVADPGDRARPFLLTLVWQALKPPEHDYTFFVHLNDAAGKRVSQRDRRPGNGSYPTTRWQTGDIVVESYEVWAEGVPGALHFAVGWYDRGDGTRLRVLDAGSAPSADSVIFPAEATN